MTTLHDFDTLLQFASELAAATTREERRAVRHRFNPPEQHDDNSDGTHPQTFLLRKMAGAIEANGSWEATPAEIRQWIREDFDKLNR